MINLLKFQKLQLPTISREYNVINGYDAEVFAASKLLTSVCGELSWGSRTEDGRQIDLICSYDHPWFNKPISNRIVFLVQVKSGSTYGEKNKSGFKLRSKAIKSALKTSNNICLIWVDNSLSKAYWAYLHPNTSTKSQNYGDHHAVCPAMRYDIARCQARFLPIDEGGNGIIFKELRGDLKERRSNSLELYKKQKNEHIINPNLGEIEFTRLGWRHMFRKNRSALHKETSLNLIPYLSILLKQKASTVVAHGFKFESIGCYKYRNIEYILKYNNTKLFDGNSKEQLPVESVIRVIETIRWPENWGNNVLNSQLIERKVKLLSAYYKYKGEGASPSN